MPGHARQRSDALMQPANGWLQPGMARLNHERMRVR